MTASKFITQINQISIQMHLFEATSTIWTNVSQFEPNWANLNKSEPKWTNLSQNEPIGTKLKQLEPNWTKIIAKVSNFWQLSNKEQQQTNS